MKAFQFFLLVFLLSIPFWIMGMFAPPVRQRFPVSLPLSSLMAICPLLAALIFVYKGGKQSAIKKWFDQMIDCKKIEDRRWYLPIIFLMPLISLLSCWLLYITGHTLPKVQLPVLPALISFAVFFIAAIGEEAGWTGYITGLMQSRWGGLKPGITIGTVWAAWHVIPYVQANRATRWILWQCFSTVFLRIIMVWLNNNTGKSLFGAILFHAMINMSMFMFTDYGSHYNPFIEAIFLLLTVIVVLCCGRPKTLPFYNYT